MSKTNYYKKKAKVKSSYTQSAASARAGFLGTGSTGGSTKVGPKLSSTVTVGRTTKSGRADRRYKVIKAGQGFDLQGNPMRRRSTKNASMAIEAFLNGGNVKMSKTGKLTTSAS